MRQPSHRLPLFAPYTPESADGPTRGSLPLLRKGFRPFFLLAALHGTLFVPFWLLFLLGGSVPAGRWPAPWWHAHEMISGFALAVVAGFLLTAVENWTRLPTARGLALGSLALLWVLGRLGFFLGAALGIPLLEAIDAIFPLGLALAIGRPLWRTRNRRNAVFPLALLVLAGAEVVTHLTVHTPSTAHGARAALGLALDVVLLFVAVVTGRIVPLFTRNATGVQAVEDGKGIGRPGLAFLVLGALAEVSGFRDPAALCFASATALLLLRARRWGLRAALSEPLLWVLHLGHAWLLLALALRVAAAFAPSLVPTSAWIHAAGAGSLGLLTLGMMTRVALGHTGRPLRTPSSMGLAFGAIALSASLRLAALWITTWRSPLLWIAAALWSLAFVAYLIRFFPVLSRPRADGRPG